MNMQSLQEIEDDDLRNILPALKRATQRVRQIAAQTQTAIIVMRDGRMVREYPSLNDQNVSTDHADERR